MAFKMSGFPSHEGTTMAKNMKDGSYKQSFEKTPLEQRSTKGGEGKDQDKIMDEKGNHIGNWVNDKKVMFNDEPVKDDWTLEKQRIAENRTAEEFLKRKEEKKTSAEKMKLMHTKIKKGKDQYKDVKFAGDDGMDKS